MLAVMRDLAAAGQTMIVVTHDMGFARQATTVHRMEAGKVVRSGPPAEVRCWAVTPCDPAALRLGRSTSSPAWAVPVPG